MANAAFRRWMRSNLLPPLRLARFIPCRKRWPQAQCAGVRGATDRWRIFFFQSAKTLAQHLITISNDVPNYYVLSFRPQSLHPGLHALEFKVKKSRLQIKGAQGILGGCRAGRKPIVCPPTRYTERFIHLSRRTHMASSAVRCPRKPAEISR